MTPRFPGFGHGSGGYESFYLRAVDRDRPRSVWLRHTVHKVPGEAPVGSVWVTIFDREAAAPVAHKVSAPAPSSGRGAWLRVGASAIGPDGGRGTAGEAACDVRWDGDAPPLRHLPFDWMYRAPLPRTKPESPLPDAGSGCTGRSSRVRRTPGWTSPSAACASGR